MNANQTRARDEAADDLMTGALTPNGQIEQAEALQIARAAASQTGDDEEWVEAYAAALVRYTTPA